MSMIPCSKQPQRFLWDDAPPLRAQSRRAAPSPTSLTWADLCRLDWRFEGVERHAERTWPGDWPEWEQIKDSIRLLTFDNPRVTALRTNEAYDLAYRYLLDVVEGRR